MLPFWVVVSQSQVLTMRALILDENMLSISFHASTDVCFVVTCGRISFDREKSRNPRTY
jgi:hypothetical protein